ncbi:LANO_0D10484g1_1 [Lachancea nothofagi CBS 11611]|uniref:LANO_0D10484g1_1 n=1 Tax=Lachancea nothofagi CBS 11611 TaxID=1266666 RepID=A0A1G4JL01_9SACH|nr:LANO_0D10484g1_1 [Lachancea nothofagi CBS 11611]
MVWTTTYKIPQSIAILAVAGTMLGMDISSMSIFLGSEYFNRYFNYPGPVIQGLMTGANPVGGLIGCVLFGILTERIGRVTTFQVVALIWILGSVISAMVLNVTMLIVGRLVRGIAVGTLSVLLPVYIGEVIPSNKKGAATSIVQLALTLAILVTFFTCFLLNFLENQISFRVAWGLEMIPALVFFLLSFCLSESPRWLVAHGQYDRAQDILQHFAQGKVSNANITKIDILEMYGTNQRTGYWDLLSKPLLKYTLIGVTVQVLVQACGINILMFYIVYICEMIGLKGTSKLSAASVPYLINVVFTCIPILTLDRLRRKLVIVHGGISLACTMTLIGIMMGCLGHKVPPVNGNSTIVWEVTGTPGLIVLALCFLFVAIFASTLSCCAWLYTNEVLPARAKSKGMALCMATSWFLNSCLTFTTPLLLSKIKWITFVLLGVVTIILSTIIAIWFPETREKKELEPQPDEVTSKNSNEDTSEVEKETRSAAPSPYIHEMNKIELIAEQGYQETV